MRRLTAVALGIAVLSAGACNSVEPKQSTTGKSTTTTAANSAPPTTAVEVGLRSGPYPAQNLVAFDNCPSVLRWAKTESLKSGWMSFGRIHHPAGAAVARRTATAGAAGAAEDSAMVASSPGSPAPLAATGGDGDTSATNNQEVGVDEADFVKTDGKILAAVAQKHLRIAVRDGANWRKAGKVELPTDAGEVLLVGSRALVLQSVHEPINPEQGQYRQRALLIVVDIANPQRPAIVDRYDIDGFVQTARLIGERVHVVVTTQQDMPFVQPAFDNSVVAADPAAYQSAYKAAAESAIRKSTIRHWVPTGRHFNGTTRPGRDVQAMPCDAISRPAVFGGNTTVSVLSLDPATSAKPTSVASVVGVASQNVYVSPKAVYITSHRYFADMAAVIDGDRAVPGGAPTTDVHRFDLTSADGAKYQGSGRIAGFVRDRYSMSEHEGVLRVVASTGWGDASQTSVFTVKPERDVLAPLGVVNGIGVTEQVQSVRFIGDLAYVVTFRRIDPLHVIDLRDPAKPRLRGELKVPGFSSYLHPISETRLLGVGHSATDEGRTTGLQLALFDISNPDAPREVKTIPVPGQQTEVDSDPRAFLWWNAKTLAAFPVLDYPTSNDGRSHVEPSMQVLGYRVTGDTITEVGKLPQRTGPKMWGGTVRSIVSGATMLTVSPGGVQTSGVDSFTETGWLEFANW